MCGCQSCSVVTHIIIDLCVVVVWCCCCGVSFYDGVCVVLCSFVVVGV